MIITRANIIRTLKEGLKQNQSVFALWLEGSDAAGKVDEYSDIDFWMDVADGKEDEAFTAVESLLSQLAPIDFKYEKDHSHPKIRQAFFHLAGTSEFLIADVCIQSHSRVFWYTKGHPDHLVKMLFDKANVIEYREPNEKQFQREIKERTAELKKTFHFNQAWAKKALGRNDFLEAMGYYNTEILEPLVELIRIKYQPLKREFYLKHIQRDLPADIVKRLEPLFQVNSVEDIKKNLDLANQWFEEL